MGVFPASKIENGERMYPAPADLLPFSIEITSRSYARDTRILTRGHGSLSRSMETGSSKVSKRNSCPVIAEIIQIRIGFSRVKEEDALTLL